MNRRDRYSSSILSNRKSSNSIPQTKQKKGLKTCQHCYNECDIDMFSLDKRTMDGLRNYCKDCEDKNKKKRSILDEKPSKKTNRLKVHSYGDSSYNDEFMIHKRKRYQDSDSDDDVEELDRLPDVDVRDLDICVSGKGINCKTNYPYYYVNERFGKIGEHRNIIVLGQSGTGKSKYLIEGVWPELNQKYDMVITLTGSDEASIYKDNMTIVDRKLCFNTEDYNKLIEDILIFNKKSPIPLHILIVIDDMSTENLSRSKPLNTLFCAGRNYNISTIVMVHKLSVLSGLARSNAHEIWVKGIRNNEAATEIKDSYLNDRLLKINPTYRVFDHKSRSKNETVKIEERNRAVFKWINENIGNPKHTGFAIVFSNHYNDKDKIFKIPSVEMLRDREEEAIRNPSPRDDNSDDDNDEDMDDEGAILSDFEDF